MTLFEYAEVVARAAFVMVALLTGFAYMTLTERKIVGWMQWRPGPNRVGPWGLLQPLADGLKLLFKEQLLPATAKKFVFLLAPCISFVVAMCAYSVIPIGNQSYDIMGYTLKPWVSDLNIGVLYLLGVSSLGVYGIILGGWASNNKYALLGGIRSSAQVISYELALGTALISPLMMVGSLSFLDIVKFQDNGQGALGFLFFSQPLAALLYWTAAVAEVNRAPFDLPEAEQELGAGYHTEYSGMKFAMFFMAEYVNMFTVSSVMTTVFCGGPLSPFPSSVAYLGAANPLWFVAKVLFFMFIFIWLRASFPRFRYDQLMRIGWLFLMPLGIMNLAITATAVALNAGRLPIGLAITAAVGVLYLVAAASRGEEVEDH